MPTDYTRGEKEFLLKIARTALEKYLFNGEKFEPQTVNQKLWEKRGVFVTLTREGELRGCIGQLEPVESLILAVRDNALAAARDPRFLPLEKEELGGVAIEISVLTEMEKTFLIKIQPGDGVIISKNGRSATYLPQVWDDLKEPDDFFASLCEKAGLPGDAWQKPGLEFYKYQALVFKEGEI